MRKKRISKRKRYSIKNIMSKKKYSRKKLRYKSKNKKGKKSHSKRNLSGGESSKSTSSSIPEEIFNEYDIPKKVSPKITISKEAIQAHSEEMKAWKKKKIEEGAREIARKTAEKEYKLFKSKGNKNLNTKQRNELIKRLTEIKNVLISNKNKKSNKSYLKALQEESKDIINLLSMKKNILKQTIESLRTSMGPMTKNKALRDWKIEKSKKHFKTKKKKKDKILNQEEIKKRVRERGIDAHKAHITRLGNIDHL